MWRYAEHVNQALLRALWFVTVLQLQYMRLKRVFRLTNRYSIVYNILMQMRGLYCNNVS